MPISNTPKYFTKELDEDELLRFVMILAVISARADIVELGRFVYVAARVMSIQDFGCLVREVKKVLGIRLAQGTTEYASDWMMRNLYEIYNTSGYGKKS